ncbi:MAG: penicillin acylase family protein, partial [Vicinamibacterales bacterium]
MRRVRRLAAWGLLVMLTLAVGTGWWARRELRGSLPRVDGRFTIAGLSAPVTVTRDELGIPSISGRSRADVARATGFVHAQDRFFQMDLSRRRAAGELSSLVGSRALPLDREIRIHRFRDQARRAVALLPPSQRQVLSAYVAGVNAGLSSLSSRPFEYLLLRQAPEPWHEEDSFLVVLSMFVTLQESNGEFETTLATMHDTLPPALFEFLVPRGTEWDAPIVGERLPAAPIPGPDVYDLRTKRTGTP